MNVNFLNAIKNLILKEIFKDEGITRILPIKALAAEQPLQPKPLLQIQSSGSWGQLTRVGLNYSISSSNKKTGKKGYYNQSSYLMLANAPNEGR